MKALVLAAVAATALISIAEAYSQTYPSRPVRLLSGSSTGSASDTSARAVAGPLGDMWKQQVVVENRPGAGGVPAAAIVAKAEPDGHTLLLCSIASHGIGPVLQRNLPYDAMRDFAPVSRMGALPNALAVHPGFAVRSVQELVAYAKENPGRIRHGSVGAGNSPHLTMAMLLSRTGIRMEHVAMGPDQLLVQEIAAGNVAVGFANLPGVLPLARAGRLRVLAVTSAKRNAQLPEVPTMIESGFAGFEVAVWAGLCAPAAVPRPIIARLNADVSKVLAMPAVRQALADRGVETTPSTPEEFALFIRAENAKWTNAAKEAGIEPK